MVFESNYYLHYDHYLYWNYGQMWLDLLRWVALCRLGVVCRDPVYRMKMQNALWPKERKRRFQKWDTWHCIRYAFHSNIAEKISMINTCVVWNEWCKELTLYGSVAARWAFWAATKSCAVWCCETPVGKCGGKYGWWCWKSAARWFPGKPDAEMPWLRRSCNVKRNLIRYEICNGRAFRCTLLHYFLNWSDKHNYPYFEIS